MCPMFVCMSVCRGVCVCEHSSKSGTVLYFAFPVFLFIFVRARVFVVSMKQ